MWIMQISDIHVDNLALANVAPQYMIKLARDSVCQIVKDDEPLILVFCGDAVYQGHKENYPSARQFLQDISDEFPMNFEFCLCPGNHDICPGEISPFEGFNQLSWALANDPSALFSEDKTVVVREIANTDFIIVNSAYHRNHTYGLVDTECLRKALDKSTSALKIMVVHHGLVPIHPSDRSAIANAYAVIKLAVASGIRAILHGHCHKQTVLRIGASACSLVGVGSLLFPPDSNVNNQFNLIRFANNDMEKAYSFRLVADLARGGTIAGFNKMKMSVI